MYCGHYTTSVNCCWKTFLFNDNRIMECDISNTRSSLTVYIYFIFWLWSFLLWWRHQRPLTRNCDVFFDLRLTNDWVNNREDGDLIRHRAHYGVMLFLTRPRGWALINESRSSPTPRVPAHSSVLLDTGREIGTDSCGMDYVFPPHDLWFGSDTYTSNSYLHV